MPCEATRVRSGLIGLLLIVAAFASAIDSWAADGGRTALPRREDITYRMPGVSAISTALQSWLAKTLGGQAAADGDSVTPAVWINGPVYGGVTWFWREVPAGPTDTAGEIYFTGFASNQDTTNYDPPVRWLPLDPASEGSWETTTTSSKNETWTFRFQYAGQVEVDVGSSSNPELISCWMLLMEQENTTPAGVVEGASARDGMGGLRPSGSVTKAWTDILYYRAADLPRRLIWQLHEFPQNELLYQFHVTRDTPVSTRNTGIGGFKARFRK